METPPPNDPQGQQPEDPKPFRPLPDDAAPQVPEPTPIEPTPTYPAPEPEPQPPVTPAPPPPTQPVAPTPMPPATQAGGAGVPPNNAAQDPGYGYAQYPRPGNYPGATGGPATIRFDVIGDAYRMVFADLQTWVLAALILVIPILILAILQQIVIVPILIASGSIIVTLFLMTIFAFLCQLVMLSLFSNMYRMAAIALTGTKPQIGEMLKFGANFGNIFTTVLLTSVIVSIGSFFCYIPGIIAAGLLMFAVPITVDKKIGGMPALQMSFETLKKDAVMATIFIFVLAIASYIGAIGCGIGLCLTLPVFPVAIMMLYRDYFGGFENAAALS